MRKSSNTLALVAVVLTAQAAAESYVAKRSRVRCTTLKSTARSTARAFATQNANLFADLISNENEPSRVLSAPSVAVTRLEREDACMRNDSRIRRAPWRLMCSHTTSGVTQPIVRLQR